MYEFLSHLRKSVWDDDDCCESQPVYLGYGPVADPEPHALEYAARYAAEGIDLWNRHLEEVAGIDRPITLLDVKLNKYQVLESAEKARIAAERAAEAERILREREALRKAERARKEEELRIARRQELRRWAEERFPSINLDAVIRYDRDAIARWWAGESGTPATDKTSTGNGISAGNDTAEVAPSDGQTESEESTYMTSESTVADTPVCDTARDGREGCADKAECPAAAPKPVDSPVSPISLIGPITLIGPIDPMSRRLLISRPARAP